MNSRLPAKVCLPTALLAMAGAAGCRTPATADIDRNVYPVVTIGTQVWLGANLRVSRDPNGGALRTHAPNDDSGLAGRYGLLYDWSTARRACMRGWHLPTDREWGHLEAALGSGAGGTLKDTAGWHPPNVGATDRSGFAARASGYWSDGQFDNMFGNVAVFWSATAADTHFVWTRTLRSGDDSLYRVTQHPNYGFAVRCIRS